MKLQAAVKEAWVRIKKENAKPVLALGIDRPNQPDSTHGELRSSRKVRSKRPACGRLENGWIKSKPSRF